MALTPILDTHLVSQLVAILNSNFAYIEGLSGGGGGGGGKFAGDLTDATGATIVTHNLGTQDIVAQLWSSSGAMVFAPIQIDSENEITVTFESAFTGRIVVRA